MMAPWLVAALCASLVTLSEYRRWTREKELMRLLSESRRMVETIDACSVHSDFILSKMGDALDGCRKDRDELLARLGVPQDQRAAYLDEIRRGCS